MPRRKQGRRRIKIYEPTTEQDPTGALIRTLALKWTVDAERNDQGGAVLDDEDQLIAASQTRFTIRAPLGNERPQADWRVVDEYGEQMVIDRVQEIQMRRRVLILHCTVQADRDDIA